MSLGIFFPDTDVLGQVRYARQFEENTVDFFGTEIGLNYKF
jgi:hypothetical protein